MENVFVTHGIQSASIFFTRLVAFKAVDVSMSIALCRERPLAKRGVMPSQAFRLRFQN